MPADLFSTTMSRTEVVGDDAAMEHAIGLLQKQDESYFARWADICDSIQITDYSGNSLLHWAAALGNLNALILLVDLGLELEARNAMDATPLLCAAASCRNPGAVIAYLMRQGADAHAKNKEGDTIYTLLERRNLPGLMGLFDQLQSAMEECPKWFASSIGNDVVSFNMAVNLGSTAAMVKDVSTVRFKNSKSLSRTTLYGCPEGKLLDDLHQGSPESVYMNSTPAQYCCDASWWLAERECLVLFAEEDAMRNLLISKYFSQFLSFLSCRSTAPIALVGLLPADTVSAVLGEKHCADGTRRLLVRWANKKDELEDDTSWVPYEEVIECSVVREYIAKFDRSYSSSIQGSYNHPSADEPHSGALDFEERSELERELDRLPRRQLSPDSTINNTQRRISNSSAINKLTGEDHATEERQPAKVVVKPFFAEGTADVTEILLQKAIPPFLPSDYHGEPYIYESCVEGSIQDTKDIIDNQCYTYSISLPQEVNSTVAPHSEAVVTSSFACQNELHDCDPLLTSRELTDGDWPSGRFTPFSQRPRSITHCDESSSQDSPQQYKLSDSQRIQYEEFLYRSALSILHRRQKDQHGQPKGKNVGGGVETQLVK